LDHKEQQERRVFKVLQEVLEPQVAKESKVLPALRELQAALLVPRGSRELLEILVHRGFKVPKGYKGCKELQDLQLDKSIILISL
jgi:hypothetical protein